jgi:hypothetical protein
MCGGYCDETELYANIAAVRGKSMFLGAILFLIIFILLAPQSRAFLTGLMVNFGTLMTAWAPFSYILVALLLGTLFAGLYVIQSWPAHVEPENPMAKYRREAPVEEE